MLRRKGKAGQAGGARVGLRRKYPLLAEESLCEEAGGSESLVLPCGFPGGEQSRLSSKNKRPRGGSAWNVLEQAGGQRD